MKRFFLNKLDLDIIFWIYSPIYGWKWKNGKIYYECFLILGGINWTVIRVERRDEYMNALESAEIKI